jgi:hypothetical protein
MNALRKEYEDFETELATKAAKAKANANAAAAKAKAEKAQATRWGVGGRRLTIRRRKHKQRKTRKH